MSGTAIKIALVAGLLAAAAKFILQINIEPTYVQRGVFWSDSVVLAIIVATFVFVVSWLVLTMISMIRKR